MTGESPWLTIAEAAARAKVSKPIVYRAIARGTLQASKVDAIAKRSAIRIHVEWVDSWLESASKPVELVPDRRSA
jgi:excisionase family DNA binding protein